MLRLAGPSSSSSDELDGETVPHTEWLPTLKKIGISQSEAKRLMSVGRNPAISNRPNWGVLKSFL